MDISSSIIHISVHLITECVYKAPLVNLHIWWNALRIWPIGSFHVNSSEPSHPTFLIILKLFPRVEQTFLGKFAKFQMPSPNNVSVMVI